MTSKEKLQKSINSLTYKESQYGLKKYEKERLECYKDVVKDLGEYEELKKLMGTPIQDIMNKLKVLDILKKHLAFRIEWNNVFFETDDCDVLLPLDDIEKEVIEEWLDA